MSRFPHSLSPISSFSSDVNTSLDSLLPTTIFSSDPPPTPSAPKPHKNKTPTKRQRRRHEISDSDSDSDSESDSSNTSSDDETLDPRYNYVTNAASTHARPAYTAKPRKTKSKSEPRGVARHTHYDDSDSDSSPEPEEVPKHRNHVRQHYKHSSSSDDESSSSDEDTHDSVHVIPPISRLAHVKHAKSWPNPETVRIANEVVALDERISQMVDTSLLPAGLLDMNTMGQLIGAAKALISSVGVHYAKRLYLSPSSRISSDQKLMHYRIDLAPHTPLHIVANLCGSFGAGRTVTDITVDDDERDEFEQSAHKLFAQLNDIISRPVNVCDASSFDDLQRDFCGTPETYATLPYTNACTREYATCQSTPSVSIVCASIQASDDLMVESTHTNSYAICVDSYDHDMNNTLYQLSSTNPYDDMTLERLASTDMLASGSASMSVFEALEKASLMRRQAIIARVCRLLSVTPTLEPCTRTQMNLRCQASKAQNDPLSVELAPYSQNSVYCSIKLVEKTPSRHTHQSSNAYALFVGAYPNHHPANDASASFIVQYGVTRGISTHVAIHNEEMTPDNADEDEHHSHHHHHHTKSHNKKNSKKHQHHHYQHHHHHSSLTHFDNSAIPLIDIGGYLYTSFDAISQTDRFNDFKTRFKRRVHYPCRYIDLKMNLVNVASPFDNSRTGYTKTRSMYTAVVDKMLNASIYSRWESSMVTTLISAMDPNNMSFQDFLAIRIMDPNMNVSIPITNSDAIMGAAKFLCENSEIINMQTHAHLALPHITSGSIDLDRGFFFTFDAAFLRATDDARIESYV